MFCDVFIKKTSRTYDSRHFETRTCTVGRRSGVGYATTVRRPTMTQIPTVEWPSSTLMIPNKSNDRRQVTVELWRRPSGDGRHSTWYRPQSIAELVGWRGELWRKNAAYVRHLGEEDWTELNHTSIGTILKATFGWFEIRNGEHLGFLNAPIPSLA